MGNHNPIVNIAAKPMMIKYQYQANSNLYSFIFNHLLFIIIIIIIPPVMFHIKNPSPYTFTGTFTHTVIHVYLCKFFQFHIQLFIDSKIHQLHYSSPIFEWFSISPPTFNTPTTKNYHR